MEKVRFTKQVFSRTRRVTKGVALVITYHPLLKSVGTILYKHLYLLHLYDHFILEDHAQFVNDASIIFIDKIDSTDLLKKEQYWRHTLKTLVLYVLYVLNVSENVCDCTIFANCYKDWTVLRL